MNSVLLEPIASALDAWFAELDRFADVPLFERGRNQPPAPVGEDRRPKPPVIISRPH